MGGIDIAAIMPLQAQCGPEAREVAHGPASARLGRSVCRSCAPIIQASFFIVLTKAMTYHGKP